MHVKHDLTFSVHAGPSDVKQHCLEKSPCNNLDFVQILFASVLLFDSFRCDAQSNLATEVQANHTSSLRAYRHRDIVAVITKSLRLILHAPSDNVLRWPSMFPTSGSIPIVRNISMSSCVKTRFGRNVGQTTPEQ